MQFLTMEMAGGESANSITARCTPRDTHLPVAATVMTIVMTHFL